MRTEIGKIAILVWFIGVWSASLAFSSPRVCGMTSGSPLISYSDSVTEFSSNVSPIIAGGLSDLYSFTDIQNLIQSVGAKRACVTAIAVSKNIYQYDEILAVIDQIDGSGKEWVTSLLLQTASIQADQNLGSKPWLGMNRGSFTGIIQSALASLQFTETQGQNLGSFSPMNLLSQIFAPTTLEIDRGSESYLYIPGIDPEWSTYLVSRLRTMDTGNPFTSEYLPDASVVQVREKTGAVRTAQLASFFDIYSQLESLQQSDSIDGTDADRLAQLQKLSEL